MVEFCGIGCTNGPKESWNPTRYVQDIQKSKRRKVSVHNRQSTKFISHGVKSVRNLFFLNGTWTSQVVW